MPCSAIKSFRTLENFVIYSNYEIKDSFAIFLLSIRNCMTIHIRMNAELERKIEFTRMLHTYCQTVRRGKNRPDLAGVAADREIELKKELDQLEKERAAQPELLHSEEAA